MYGEYKKHRCSIIDAVCHNVNWYLNAIKRQKVCTYVALFCVRGMENVRFSGYIYIFMRRIPNRERTNGKNKETNMKKVRVKKSRINKQYAR